MASRGWRRGQTGSGCFPPSLDPSNPTNPRGSGHFKGDKGAGMAATGGSTLIDFYGTRIFFMQLPMVDQLTFFDLLLHLLIAFVDCLSLVLAFALTPR